MAPYNESLIRKLEEESRLKGEIIKNLEDRIESLQGEAETMEQTIRTQRELILEQRSLLDRYYELAEAAFGEE